MTDEVLHLVARILLRVCSPQRASTLMGNIGSVLPNHRNRFDLMRVSARIRNRGTCLSRALAVAARAPDATVAIGVTPLGAGRPFAHAWVELAGEAIDPLDVAGGVIARMRPVRRT